MSKERHLDHKEIQKKLKPHSLRYEEIIRKSKNELNKKRNLQEVEESLGHPISYREKSKLLKDAANREAIAKI